MRPSQPPRATTTSPRAPWIHYAALLGSMVGLAFMLVEIFRPDAILGIFDLALSGLFAAEFLTRSGLRRSGLRYVAWRWFDFVAMLPILWFQEAGMLEHAFWFWIVFVARLGRAVDRTLGDGYFLHQFAIVVEGIEEEVSDRVIVQVMSRLQKELADARFGSGAAEALRKNRGDILKRIYAEQLKDTGFTAKLAHFTGLQNALEHAEARIYDSIVEMVGSPETDAMIADIVRQSMGRASKEIGERSWTKRLGERPPRPSA